MSASKARVKGSALEPSQELRPLTAAKAIAIGSDDAGYRLKEELKKHLQESGQVVKDYGCDSPDPVDYPDIAVRVARAVANGAHDRAILVCGTGMGMAIAANKVPGVYATVAHDAYSAGKARTSNNAQVLALGARIVAPELAAALVDIWMRAEFAGGASARKVHKIERVEDQLLGGPAVRPASRGRNRRSVSTK